jgi:hypothetical protein
MAERRMFAKTIIDSDAFLDMPLSTQSLYFHLSMRADDDGFINNPKKIQRMIGAADDDLKVLVAKNFIIPFESGIVVIKHWKIHNYIRNDRYKETVYKDEKSQLFEKRNKSYTLNSTDGMSLGIPNDNQMETQVRLGKVSIDKESIDKDNIVDIEEKKKEKASTKHKHGDYKHVLLTDSEYSKLLEQYGSSNLKDIITYLDEYLEMKGTKYKSHYMVIKKWGAEAALKKRAEEHKSIFQSFLES